MRLKHRLQRIEAALQPERVVGLRTDDGPVKVFATGEELSLAAFEDRYPNGKLIHIITVNRPRHESRSPSP